MSGGEPGGAGYTPSRCSRSARLTAVARTRTRTSPREGSGVGTSRSSRTSGPPGFAITMARMGRECISPMVRCASLVRWSEASRDRTCDEPPPGCARGATRSSGSRRARRASSFQRPKDGDESDLGWWSALDLGRSDYLVARSGPFAGLGLVAIPHDCYSIVRDRAARDSIHAGPTREHRARLPGVRRLLPGQSRRARGRRHRALRAGRAGRARAPALCQARRRQGRPRPPARQALQAPGGRQPLRHLPHPPRRVQHVPRRKRVLPLVARRRAGDRRRRHVS